jgi:hypothetical protein
MLSLKPTFCDRVAIHGAEREGAHVAQTTQLPGHRQMQLDTLTGRDRRGHDITWQTGFHIAARATAFREMGGPAATSVKWLGLPAGMGGAAVRIEHAVPHQPIARILGILIKPLRGTSQPERIAPLIHVAAHAFAANVRQRLRHYDL